MRTWEGHFWFRLKTGDGIFRNTVMNEMLNYSGCDSMSLGT